MNTIRFFLIHIFLCLSIVSFSQRASVESVKALNNYVHFTNESIHGMMIVHRLMEGFNQEVNQYVDKESTKLNFYSNQDLPKNVFIDKEKMFYRTSPYQWYEIAKKESKILLPQEATVLNRHLEKLKQIIGQVNQARFDLELFIKKNDLQDSLNQTQIYLQLEYCSDWYEKFYLEKEELRKDLNFIYRKNYFKQTPSRSLGVPVLKDLHNNILPILKSLRYEVTGTLPELTKKVEANVRKLDNIVNIHKRYKTAKTAAQTFLTQLQNYQNGTGFDEKYIEYGDAYYFHNVHLVAAINNYSGRMVKATNEMIELESPFGLLLTEEPHILNIVYPDKPIERPDNQEVIEAAPTEVLDRNVIVRQQSIIVNEREFTMLLYDHKQEDGDVLSINLNGKWIIEHQELKKKPLKFKVKLNTQGQNYLLLHAEDLGTSPPNTAALVYYVNGKRKQVVLNSNLHESEMIKLEYQAPSN